MNSHFIFSDGFIKKVPRKRKRRCSLVELSYMYFVLLFALANFYTFASRIFIIEKLRLKCLNCFNFLV
jgi:hypothetical protein